MGEGGTSVEVLLPAAPSVDSTLDPTRLASG